MQARDTKPKGSDKAATGHEGLSRLTTEILDLFMNRVSDAVARTGVSTIDPEALQQIADRIARGRDPALAMIYERNWGQLQQTFEQAFWARMRKFPLERLIVSTFEPLLAPRDAAPVRGRTLSRRVIPATIGALHQMIGPDLFEEYEARARDLVEAVRTIEGDEGAWPRLYHHPQAQILVSDILVYIARYFTDVPKRRQWMVDFMDRSLPAAQNDSERDWAFGDREFHLLIGGLFGALALQLEDPAQRARLVRRYGDENVRLVEEVLTAIDRDRHAIAR
ncbi:hypothetical protein KAJ83_08540 [Marivibrio halodurans]|uniref:Uncharacterized protein n=1 Tax=Marivibrio halodurans TaxID=2039722 RepID=A0A8J7S1P3_9PROT|nr:hypothetical protein [Marivibrio halodurans]MBP5857054.1 hypothetical protein [Marivibrio halodurans]